jgi:O-antigen/teichoic acid export membrane protein
MKLSLTTQAGLLAASRAAAQVLNALVGIVVVRFITQEDYGTFRQIYLLIGTLVIMTDLGLVESLYYFLPRLPQRRAAIIRRSVFVVGAAQFAVGAALLLGRGQIGRFFNNADLPHYMGLLALFLGMSTLTRLWEVQLIAEQRVPLASVVTGGFEALKVGLMFATLLVEPTIAGLLWAMVASAAIKFAAYLWFLARDFPGRAEPAPGERGGHFRYAMALWVPGMLNTLAMQAHQFIVGYSFTPAEYAIYAVACFQVPLIGVLTTSIIEVMLVRVTAARAQNREDEVRQVWFNASTKSLAVFVPMAIGLAVLAQPLIVLLFTRNYAAAAPLFAILMFSLPLNAVFTNNMLRAYGAMTDYAKFYTVRLLLGLALGIAGVAWLGMWGVALSSVLTGYLIVGWQLRRVAELLHLRFLAVLPWRAIGKILLAAIVAGLPAAACARWIPSHALALAAGLPLYAVTYALLAFRLGLVDREEMRNLTGEARRILARLGLGAKADGAVLTILAAWLAPAVWQVLP